MLTFKGFSSFGPLVHGAGRGAATVYRRRWAFVAATALPIVATLAYVIHAPDRYAGTARLIVGKEAEPATLAFTAALASNSLEVENQLEMIKSPEVARRAAARGRERYAEGPPTEDEVTEALTVKPVKGSDIIEIRAEAASAARAAALANLVADAYLEVHLRDRRKSVASSRRFIEKQVDAYEKRLRASETALEEYKRTTGVASLPAETTELVGAEAGFNKELAATRIDLAVAKRKQSYLEEEIRDTQSRLLAEATDVSSPVARQLQDKLITLEYRYANLILKGYEPSHPELVALLQEIALAKGRLAEAAAAVAGGAPDLNLFAKLESAAQELDAVRGEVAALKTRERELAGAAGTAASRLAALPAKESHLARLTREKEADEKIYMMLLEKREEARIAEASEVGLARVFSRAVPPPAPFAPRRKQSLLLGILTGLLCGAAAVSLLEYLDRTVKHAAVAREVVGAAVLGVIPTFSRRSSAAYKHKRFARASRDETTAPVVVRAPKSPPAEAFRTLYAQLSHLLAGNGSRDNVAFAITSARPQEGKSTVAANVAAEFAAFGTTTLLVDADFERPTLANIFGADASPGLADFLYGETTWEDIITRTAVPNLRLITAGGRRARPSALLATSAFGDVVARAREEFALTVVDVPPVFPVADVALVAPTVRKFLLVVRAGAVGPAELDRAAKTVRQVGGEILGVVLNGAERSDTYGYGYYRYYYERARREESLSKT